MNLVELGQGVFAWTHPSPQFGDSNVGLVIDADGLTIIDTTATPEGGEAVRRAALDLTAELGPPPIRRVVLTSSRIAFSGGGAAFRQAACYGSEATSEQLDTPADPGVFRRLLPHLASAYHDEFATRPVTHTVAEPAALSGAITGLPLAGESPVNLVATVEAGGKKVAFAGALGSFGVTPLAFDGDPLAWAASLAQLMEMADTIVPGHGSVGGAADIGDQLAYLVACAEADGDPDRIGPGPWDGWTDRRFDAVNVERAARLARGDHSVPHAMLELLDLA